ncbi:UPF0149 family protein [Chitinilyticum piscinae]|uniref:YecA family protein n=1 Tax=Chitinilyticum piscinae TaxID=2866724 RepID=A0A8J7K9L0_9NEIS|nr:UPF0149 family protein [Chitinilyticum piscinae]MBE9608314.1 YecA family protein [Chitinilyticum piscinae]
MNQPVAPALSEADIDRLDQFLARHADQDGLDVSMLHGYLTAIQLSPVQLHPRDWMPRISGPDAAPKFESQAESEQITALIMAYYNEIASALRSAEPVDAFDPVLYFDDDGKPDCSGWSLGFVIGMHLFAQDVWLPYFEREDTATLLSLMMALAGPESTAELQKQMPAEVNVHEAIAAELAIFVVELQQRIQAIEAERQAGKQP